MYPTLVTGKGSLPKLDLVSPDGARAEIYLQGGHVTSWKTPQGDERLFLSASTEFKPGVAIRGGIPVIFPQFGGFGLLVKHGFARLHTWELENVENSPTAAQAVLSLNANPATLSAWPHLFRLSLVVTVGGARLDLRLSVTNMDQEAFRFNAALHTYLRVADLSQAVLTGLEQVHYHDSVTGRDLVEADPRLSFTGEVDRIYSQAPARLTLQDSLSTTCIEHSGFKDAVVWNPGEQRGATLADLEPGGYRRYVCVEGAAINEAIILDPGQTWQGQQTLTLET